MGDTQDLNNSLTKDNHFVCSDQCVHHEHPMMFNRTMEEVAILQRNIDDLFHITMGCFVFFMQPGFAFLEAGSVRSKNTVNIIMKNMLDILVGGIMYWCCGWALSHGPEGNAFAGSGNFFMKDLPTEMYPIFFFDYVFASTAITIVSGSIAERCHILAYMIYSVVISGWVYPICAHWIWGGRPPEANVGWLSSLKYHDFAGSGGVHLLGGTAALVGCYLIRPRKGRFSEDGQPNKIPGHSMPLSALGGFFLVIGFLAFNGGTQASITGVGDSGKIGIIILNTLLGGCSGGLSVLLLCRVTIEGKWSYHLMLNGTLTGIIAQCAGCDVFRPSWAVLVGVLGGLVFLLGHKVMEKLQLDDPLDAVAVHGGGGLLGVLIEPFFALDDGIFFKGNEIEPWQQLGVNCLGAIAIIAWSALWSFLIFGVLKSYNLLRIDENTELYGHDLLHHGEAAYPLDAWLEYQYETQSTENTTLNHRLKSKSKRDVINDEKQIEDSNCSAETTKKGNEKQERLEVPKKSSTPSSIDGQRKDREIVTIDRSVRAVSPQPIYKANSRLRYTSFSSNFTNIDGEVNSGYVEDTVGDTVSSVSNRRIRTVSTPSITQNRDLVSNVSGTDSINDKTSQPPIEVEVQLTKRNKSLDAMSLSSIIV